MEFVSADQQASLNMVSLGHDEILRLLEDGGNETTQLPMSSAATSNSTTSHLTDAQEMVIALTPLLPAVLSICGSLTLLRLLHKAKYRRPYRRILCGMSCYDILNSVTVCLQTFLTPADTSRRLWAIGNDASCQALGFLFQFSYPSFMYFGILSVYYVLVVRFRVTDAFFARRIEPFLHVITLLWPTITAIVGLHLGLFGEVSIGAGCWISEQAIDETCDADCIAQWTWIMGGLPFILIFGLVLLNNLLIYWHVRTTIYAVTRPRSSSSQGQRQSLSLAPESQEAKVRAVGTQALLYCGVFILTYCWTIILRLASNDGAGPPQEPTVFPIMVLRAIFLPAMGLGTVLVYTRPRYVLLRNSPAYSDKSRFWILQQVLWYENDPARCGGGSSRTQGTNRTPPNTKNGDVLAINEGGSSQETNRFWMPSIRRLVSRSVASHSRSASLVVRDSNDDNMSAIAPDDDNKDQLPVLNESDAELLQSTSFHNSTTHTVKCQNGVFGVSVSVVHHDTEASCHDSVEDLSSGASMAGDDNDSLESGEFRTTNNIG